MKKNYRDLLCLGLTGVLYHFAILKSVLIPMHIPVKSWQMLLFSLAAILFFFLVETRPGRIVFLCTIGLGVGYIAYTLIAHGLDELIETLEPVVALGKAMLQIGTGYYDQAVSDATLMWTVGLFALVLAIPVYYLLVPRLRFYWLVVPGIGLFITLWAMFRHVDKIAFYVFITVAIVFFIYYKYMLYRKKDSDRKEMPSGANTIVFFVPVVVLILLLASMLGVRDLPIQWPWMDEKINTWYWQLHEKYNVDRYDKFTLSNTGFGDPGRLGGPVYPDFTPIMVVKSPARVYLRGAVYDEYTGTGWNRTEQQELADTSDRTMDLLELRYGWKLSSAQMGLFNLRGYREFLEGKMVKETQEYYVQNGSGQYSVIYSNNSEYVGDPILEAAKAEPSDYLNFLRLQQIPQILSKLHPEEALTVRHLNVRTRTLFTPLKTYAPINGLPGYTIVESLEGTFEADVRLQGNSEYEFNYIQPAYGMDALELYYQSSSPGLYQKFRETNTVFISELEKYGIVNADNVRAEIKNLLEVYQDLEEYRDGIYSRYTKLPETISKRVKDIALNITVNKHTTYEKVQALEKHLRENYTYTLQPGVPPENWDFVDYFLYEGKEGYCSYYASALCVLARTVGIPARYVEGFVMPEKPDENGFYHVTNQSAHAWVEVYLEGAGWVTFEPTPPYAGVMNYLVSLADSDGEGYIQELPPEIPDQYQYMPNNLPMDMDFSNNDRSRLTPGTTLMWAGVVILALMLLNLMVVLLRRLIFRWMPAAKSVPGLYGYIVKLLKHAGCVIKPGETPMDFAKRVDERFQFIHMTMNEMVELFYSVRFGAHKPDKKTLNKLFAFTGEIKSKSGRTMYFHKRILFRGLLFRG